MKRHLMVISKQLPQKAFLQRPWYRNVDLEKIISKLVPEIPEPLDR